MTEERDAKRPRMEAAAQRAMTYTLAGRCGTSAARAGAMRFARGPVVHTPVFMPVGTQGTLKGLTCEQLRGLGCEIMLGNTYHLGLRPGEDLLRRFGGLHRFMGDWTDSALLTDSGGFQMVSLLKLARITEEGVLFQSPHGDGTEMLLTPEKSMELQNAIGADIMMQLDDVVATTTTGPRVEEAMERTIRWLDRCIAAHSRKGEQSLFPIVQGGTDLELRTRCIDALLTRDAEGYAIGGLSGGEEKDLFWRVVRHCTERLPADRPIYCMGVGYAVDLVVCVALGVDMFDCVYPTRTARFGTALTRSGNMVLRNAAFRNDYRPIDAECKCPTCVRRVPRAILSRMAGKEATACHMLTLHNVYFQLDLMRRARETILADTFPAFVSEFMSTWFGSLDAVPVWVRDALASVGISL